MENVSRTRWMGALIASLFTLQSLWPIPVSAAPTTAAPPESLDVQSGFRKVAELVEPAVVSIVTTHVEQAPGGPEFFFGDPFQEFFNQYFGNGSPDQGDEDENGSPMPAHPRHPHQYKFEGMGSGVIIDANGMVLTNEHVVHDADQIKVMVYDKDGQKKEYSGHVVGKDARTDIAVVRIHAGHKLPFAALGDSDKVKVGDWAIAVGSPFGLAQTLTVGVISADRQSLEIEGREYKNLIQTDAAINRGNSGGPLVNIHGEVVGINTAIYAPTGVFAGIGFAIPVNQAKAILTQLIQKGHVVRGWLGVELAKEISPAMVRAFNLPDTKGALVNEVMKGSPADKAGLQRGDVIRTFDGKTVQSPEDLQTLVSQTPPKKSVSLEVIRQKKKITLTLVIGERPESADTGEDINNSPQASKEEKRNEKFWHGAHIAPFTSDMADKFHQPQDAQGVLVIDVDPDSAAETMGLMPGDIIRAVNQNPTPDPAAFESAVSGVKLSEGVVFDILRQGHPIYLSYTNAK